MAGGGFGRGDHAPEIRCKFLKANGAQCKRAANVGEDFCHIHRGGVKHRPESQIRRGMDNNLFKDGRYSKYIPERMLQRFNDNLRDEDLIELRREMALVDTRVEELLEALEHPEATPEEGLQDHGERNTMSNKGWALVRAAWLKYEAALHSAKDSRIRDARYELKSLIMEGREEFNVWNDIASLLELRRKLSETEHKRQEALQHYVQIDRVMVLLSATIGSIKLALEKYVTDEDARRHVVIEAEATYQKYISAGADSKPNQQSMAG